MVAQEMLIFFKNECLKIQIIFSLAVTPIISQYCIVQYFNFHVHFISFLFQVFTSFIQICSEHIRSAEFCQILEEFHKI